MARKKRLIEQPALPTNQAKEPVAYEDRFQHSVNRRIDGASKKFEGKGKNVLYALAAVAVLAVLIGIFYTWNRRSTAAAHTALGKAIETSQATVSEAPVAGAAPTGKTFKTHKERAEAAIGEFQTVADKYSGEVAEKARYFIAVNKLMIDRPAALQELENFAKSNDEVGKLSKFALAQAKTDDGKLDEAVALYQELAAIDNPIIAKDTIDFQLAQIYEKQNKKLEAEEIYFRIAKTASDAKDSAGKAIPFSPTAREAKDKLEALNPERAKQIPESSTASPLGM